jgi:hypothetical protein
LLENQLLKQYFNNDEIAELNQISRFFQSKIAEGCPYEDQDSCYHHYVNGVLASIREESGLDYRISDAEVDSLFSELDTAVFGEVFGYRVVTKHVKDEPSIQITTLDINMQGKYFAFLRDLSSEKKVLVGIIDAVTTAGVWMSGLDIGFLEEAALFDYDDPVDRLILAVHYLIADSRIVN